MKRRGRPGLGAGHVERVEGSAESKERLAVILKTLTGELSVRDACEKLGVSEPHLHRLRERALAGAAEALEPRPAGRRAAAVDPSDARVAELEKKLDEMEMELRASQVREEIALVMPHLLKVPGGDQKKRRGER